MKITRREKGETPWGERKLSPSLPRLAWGVFHARSRFVRSSLSEEKWGLFVVYPIIDSGHKRGPSQNLKEINTHPSGLMDLLRYSSI